MEGTRVGSVDMKKKFEKFGCMHTLAVFILEDALCVWTNLGKHSSFVWLFVSSVKTSTRRIIRPDELSSVVRRSSLV